MSQKTSLSKRTVRKAPFALTLTLLLAAAPLGAGCGDDDDDDRNGVAGAGRGGSAQGGGKQTGGAGGKSTAGAGGSGAEMGGAGTSGFGQGGEGGGVMDAVDITGDRRIPFTPETDREFTHFFIEHHEMAIHMAEMVVENATTPSIQDLAERMVTAQTAEVATLRAVEEELQDQPEPPPMPMDPHHEADMAHMMTLTGAELEQMFLLDMIQHHAAGLPPAHRAMPHLTHPDLQAMAESIAREQAAEIGEMKTLLDGLNVTTAGEDMAEAAANRPDFGLVGDRRVPVTPDDVTFIDFFVPHHEMAVMMAEHVIAHGENAEVQALAEKMRTAQLQEIETMQTVREELTGEAEPDPMPADPHMVPEMEEMMEASGLELDVMFLAEMIAHHAGGLPTAHRAKPHVENTELAAMSDAIYHAQAEEIGEMQRLLEELRP
jgi:uncharacterized protein (DUF305 family)